MKLSYSNFATFRQCPKKWYYAYVEMLEEKRSENLLLGSLFHTAIEKLYKGEDPSDTYKEYNDAVLSNELSTDLDLLETVANLYTTYYAKKDSKEKILSIEKEMKLEWENDDYIVGLADRVVEDQGLVVVRDTKTTKNALKYTPNTVRYNPQLLLYAAMVEELEGIKVDAIEIDEVRLAHLQKPQINKNGKPTADKNKLGLVTYQTYYNTLVDMGLEDDDAYQGILDYLKKRGHPLFKRVRIQIHDDVIVNQNINELYSSYQTMKMYLQSQEGGSEETLVFPRHRSRLCDWCAYQDLCNLDYYDPTDEERELIIAKNLRKKDPE